LMENGNALTKTILAISENGYGKRTRISAYSITRRGSKGVITLKTNERNGHLAALMLVDENDDLVIITQEGMIIRQKVSDISIFERNTQGVHLINLRENDKVVDITIIPKEPDEEELDREVEKAKNAPSMQASNTMEDVTEEQDEEEEFRDEELPEEE